MRRNFCGGATWADDQSSYNIYLYGGFGFGENVTGFDDVYILTMPTFEWIKWYPTTPGPGSPHGLLTCNVIDRGQMIVMGGNFTNSTACDVPDIQGQHNLNLGQYDSTDAKWYPYLPNLTEYFVPPAILQVAGGTPEGGAINNAPATGWSDDRLSVYFGEKAVFSSRTPTRALPTATATPPPPKPTPPHPPSKKTDTGAVVGGAVGGAVGLVLAIAIAWLCMRRHKKKNTDRTGAAPAAPAATTPMPGVAQAFSSTSQQPLYVTNEKHSTTVGSPGSTTSRVGSPSDQLHSSQYSTPPPPQPPALLPHPDYPNYYYAATAPLPGQPPPPTMQYYPVAVPGLRHQQPAEYAYPAQGGQPMAGPMPFYPPPADPIRTQSHEMPTVRSPEIVQVHQPKPVRPEGLEQ